MSEKALKWAVGVLAGLVIVYAAVLLLRSRGGGGSEGVALAKALEGLSADEVRSVSIVGPSDTIDLEASDSTWTVNGFTTEKNAVDRFWSAVGDARVGGLIASNPANHRRLGVAEDSTWSVTFHRASGGDVRVLLGKSGPSYTSSYARLPDEDEVYLLEGGLRGAAGRRIDDWRDRTIATVDTASVARVVIGRGGASATLSRGQGEEGGWLVDGAQADSTVVRNLLQELSSIEATGFAAPDDPFDGSDQRSLVAEDAEGDTLAAVEIRIEDSEALARAAGNPVLFRLSTFRADRIAPDLESLAAKESDGSG